MHTGVGLGTWVMGWPAPPCRATRATTCSSPRAWPSSGSPSAVRAPGLSSSSPSRYNAVLLKHLCEAIDLNYSGWRILMFFWVVTGIDIECSEDSQTFFKAALIKKETKLSSYIRKFRWDRVQSHLWGRASYYMRKCDKFFPHIWGVC